jgi:hypothetical protein
VDDPQSDHSIPRQSADQQRNSHQTSLTGEPSCKDETRIGQKNGLVRQWAKRGTRPRQPADQRYDNACLFGAICPARGVGAALALPYADTQALSASQIVALYAKRWTIEPSFRDTNDLRFGMGMNELRIGDPQRRDRLLLLNAFAVVLLTILGAAGETLGMDRQLRTSTAKRRVHSLFRQSCLLYELIPNMPEHRLRPLIQKFTELLGQNAALTQTFGLV